MARGGRQFAFSSLSGFADGGRGRAGLRAGWALADGSYGNSVKPGAEARGLHDVSSYQRNPGGIQQNHQGQMLMFMAGAAFSDPV